MRFVQYLIEASNNANVYNQFAQDFQRDIGQDAPSAQKLVGLLNRRAVKPGQDEVADYITNWFTKKGFLQQKGSMVVPTPKGSELRQSLSAPSRGTDDSRLTNAAGQGFKALRKYFMDVTDENVKQYLETLDEDTLKAIATGRELEQEDIAILNGIRDRAENHRERASYVQAMKEKNPDRLARLESLGFIDTKTGGFNKGVWDKFVATINALDPARIKTLIPGFYQWATHSAGNTARNINRILFAIHPSSRNRTEKGRIVWDILRNLDDATFNLLKNGKKPKQGELGDEAYQLLTTIVPSVIRSFPDADNADGLIKQIDDSFDSRVDFKSLDRSSDKTAARRQGVRDTLRQY
jgi:hypothetical protein